MPAGFCRDCFAWAVAPAPTRCPTCGSPRMVAHAELPALSIAHVDCDAFYASIEKRDRPELRDQAVIVGGSERGVVLTACYNARIHGVRSAMPMFKARKLCPHAVIVRPDMQKYASTGRAIRAMMLDLTPLVQPVSIDEAFLDLSGTEGVHGAVPAVTLARFAQDVERTHGITISIGLSDCKFLAKLASDLDKPRGYTVIGPAEAAAVLRPKPVGAIWGVGAVSQARLATLGFSTIGDIQDCTEAEFARRIGSEGSSLWRLAFGLDSRTVSPTREAKSISSETTFRSDLSAADELLPILYQLCEKVAARLVAGELSAAGVVLKLKTKDFRLKTRSRSPLPPTQLAARLFEAGRTLLLPELDGTRYRLIGLGAAELRHADEADRADLIDTTLDRQKAAAKAIDAVRAKFGQEALVRGITMGRDQKRR
ncbi:DNA polymerase IV [Beijerinckiaceae bacterium RH AL1]|nr:DNA polymerase IV [Beijerinckiaceae bacterium]VVB46333.1 DNA polymerase IV [Beijerinckiaceae bacterium RH CH11]VVB46418.1 DNA polymerase IV [Beijerinckiaceae bacterium RH AL8]VVC55322.1 DNA polymerase IV [Beijerinckiaceae bacterium RH AL1]